MRYGVRSKKIFCHQLSGIIMFTNKSPFMTSSDDRYFEDYQLGDVHEFGEYKVDQTEIIEFATKYDPQYFHIDPVKANDGPFGEVVSSGFHNCAMAMRLLVDNYLSTVAGLASPGLKEVRWLKPVRSDDRLWIRVTVKEARLSVSKPDRGVITSLLEMFNQNDELVMTFEAAALVLCRP